MQNLDPTYLRYIYDNLIKGSVHPENTSELPDGLIGLYEEAFEEHLPVLQRQQLLQRFALLALLKKEVSAAFVAEILGVSEQEILDFINTYASWFNSPEPGKFQLYHERLKVYVLQKLSEKELQVVHENLITRLELAIEQQKADEYERYALEFLSEHLTVEAFGDETKGKKLLNFTKNETLWDRQIRISNKFQWSRKGLKNAALWSSKKLNENYIYCYLDIIKLHYKEQDDFHQIFSFLESEDLDLAFERINSIQNFTPNDIINSHVQLKFIIYIHCILEYLFLDNKNLANHKNNLEKILIDMNKNLNNEYSLINKCIFPSYLLYLIALELEKKELDFSVIIVNIQEWNFNWINLSNDYDDIQWKVMVKIASLKNNYNSLYEIIKDHKLIAKTENSIISEEIYDDKLKIINLLYQLNKFNLVIQILEIIENKYEEISFFLEIFYKNKNNELFKNKLLKYCESIRYYEDSFEKIKFSMLLSHELLIQYENINSDLLINNAIKSALSLKIDWMKISSLVLISSELAKQQNLAYSNIILKKSVNEASLIKNVTRKLIAELSIYNQFYINRNFKNANILLENLIISANKIKPDWRKFEVCSKIAVSLIEKNKLNFAELIINNSKELLKNDETKLKINENSLIYSYSYSVSLIALEFASNNDFNIVFRILNFIIDEEVLSNSIKKISEIIILNEELFKLFFISKAIKNEEQKILTLLELLFVANKNHSNSLNNEIITELINSLKLSKNRSFKDEISKKISQFLANKLLYKDSLEIIKEIDNEDCKKDAIYYLIFELVKIKKYEEFFEIRDQFIKTEEKNYINKEVSIMMLKNYDIDLALKIASEITDKYEFYIHILNLSIELIKQKKIKESLNILEKIPLNKNKMFFELDFFKDKNEDIYIHLSKLSLELIKQKEFDTAMSIVDKMSNFRIKKESISKIIDQLVIQDDLDYAQKYLEILDDKNNHIKNIIIKLLNQNKPEEGLKHYYLIPKNNLSLRFELSIKISNFFFTKNDSIQSLKFLEECFLISNEMVIDFSTIKLLKELSIEILNQGLFKLFMESIYKIHQFEKNKIENSKINNTKSNTLNLKIKKDKGNSDENLINNEDQNRSKNALNLLIDGNDSDALIILREIKNINIKYSTLMDFSNFYFEQGLIEKADFSLNEILAKIKNICKRDNALNFVQIIKKIAIVFVNRNKFSEALEVLELINPEKNNRLANSYNLLISDLIIQIIQKNGIDDIIVKLEELMDYLIQKSILNIILKELILHNKTNEVYLLIEKILEEKWKCEYYKLISLEFIINNNIDESTHANDLISFDDEKIESLLCNVDELILQNKIELSLNYIYKAYEISNSLDVDFKDYAIVDISKKYSIVLLKLGKIDESMSEILKLKNKYNELIDFNYYLELANLGYWEFLEKDNLNVNWERIIREIFNKNEPIVTYNSILNIKNIEIRNNCVQFWSNLLMPFNINDELVNLSLPYISNDILQIENLLSLYGAKRIIFDNEYSNKFINILNLQWAIDLKNELDQLPN